MVNTHEYYINRCLEIAKNGLGTTRPNPMVGCVIVVDGKIIGEGYTSVYGGNHAEANAIHSVINKNLLVHATLYVSLEPCSHYGKTPPCSDLIIKYKIKNVVIGCIDENDKVAGNGIKALQISGCNVTVGVLETECKKHHKRFLTYHNKKRPYIILKWAESTDGYISPTQNFPDKLRNAQPTWITNAYSRQLVHKWRAEEQAILVGTKTVIMDNPSLTARDWIGDNPTRVVIDSKERLSDNFNVFNNKAKTIKITNSDINFSKDVAKQICELLYNNNITSLIVEGGLKTLQTFIDENIWDEARVFIGTIIFKNGVKAPIIKGTLISEEKIMTDTLKIYEND